MWLNKVNLLFSSVQNMLNGSLSNNKIVHLYVKRFALEVLLERFPSNSDEDRVRLSSTCKHQIMCPGSFPEKERKKVIKLNV